MRMKQGALFTRSLGIGKVKLHHTPLRPAKSWIFFVEPARMNGFSFKNETLNNFALTLFDDQL